MSAIEPLPSAAPTPRTITVALVGNPNTGKSTLFNVLAGVRQRTGNYPGVTVEKHVGTMLHCEQRFELVDLPGAYSLAPQSPDEMVTVDVLLGRRADVRSVDVVLSIVDANNLERNLYLVSQVMEMGLPTVVALNMVDMAEKNGVKIDAARLAERLGAAVVPLQAHRKIGVAELKMALAETAQRQSARRISPFPDAFCREVQGLETQLNETPLRTGSGAGPLLRYLIERLLLDSGGYVEESVLGREDGEARAALVAARERLKSANIQIPAVEAISRYDWARRMLEGVVTRPAQRRKSKSDTIDRVLTHKVWGTLFFALLMALVFTSLFRLADPLMGWIDAGIGAGAGLVEAALPAGALQSLLVDGIIGGVGAVVIFLPQIMILFLFIAVMEDCGYMARAAYLMDNLMVRVGLSGKSFIPLLSSFACAVPGIMATRVIEHRRDRITTMLVAPLMSCSARLPVYVILIGAFIPSRAVLGGVFELRGLTLFAMYLIGVATAIVVGLVLRKTLLQGETPPFVMELPDYKIPSPRLVVHRMVERGWAFVKRAGTVIFAVSIVVWAVAYYPRGGDELAEAVTTRQLDLTAQLAVLSPDDPEFPRLAETLAQYNAPAARENLLAAQQQRQSYLGRMGQWIEPAVKPLGWDWRIGCAAIASFPAREVVMGVLGVIYDLGGDLDVGAAEDQHRLAARMQQARWDDTGEKVYNIPVALSIMVFFALCAQCAATLAVIKRETNSWRWPIFTFVYMTVLAYLGALATYQIGMWLMA